MFNHSAVAWHHYLLTKQTTFQLFFQLQDTQVFSTREENPYYYYYTFLFLQHSVHKGEG